MKMKGSTFFLFLLTAVLMTSCSKDEENTEILNSTEYQLMAVDGSGVTGKATFTKDSNGTTEVLIKLNGSSTSVNPAFIRFNSAAEGGPVALTLTSCECSEGHTVVSKLDNGNSISYEGLLQLDGHISIHKSPNDLDTIVAVANIGANAN